MYNFDPNPRIYGPKPVVDYSSRLTGRRKWRCRMFSAKHNRVIVGLGSTPEYAYKAYLRNLEWRNKGCPGAYPGARYAEH